MKNRILPIACFQYNPYNKEEEVAFSSITDPDPLGTPLEHLPGENITETGVELETEGYRIGFPKDTHCDHSRSDGKPVFSFTCLSRYEMLPYGSIFFNAWDD